MRKLSTLGLAAVLLAMSFAASGQEAYTTRSVNIRGGPDTSYPPVAVLAPGAPLQVMGCLDDWSWCDVAFGSDRGWIYAPYVSYVYQGERVPFYSYAPSFGIPIVAFALGSYWDRYYRGRSFYGRRDYWEHRAAPQHFRPSGPAPRATAPSIRERADFRSQNNRPSSSSGFTGNRGNPSVGDNRSNRGTSSPGDIRSNRGGTPAAIDNRASRVGGAPSGDRRTIQGAPSGGPTPSGNRGGQEMHRGPTAAAAPAPPSRGAAPQGHAPEGNKGQHAGGKDEPHR